MIDAIAVVMQTHTLSFENPQRVKADSRRFLHQDVDKMKQKNHTPFLDCRRVNNDPVVFQLGSNATPVSIRDQMIRAHLFIKQAIGEGILGTDKEFLVVGAGMAGVCAAMAAAKMMILTTLIEMNEDILCRQAEAISRLVATTQYDWPFVHWDLDKHPWDQSTYELPLGTWNAKPASLLVIDWRQWFH